MKTSAACDTSSEARSVLLDGLRFAASRAAAVSAAEDLPREYLNVLLPVMPELAPDLLRGVRAGDYGEGYLMLDHAPLLARHAREAFFARLPEAFLPVSPVEVLARAAEPLPVDERAPLRALAHALMDSGRHEDFAAHARLAWAGVEPEGGREGLVDEALARMQGAAPHTLCRAARCFLGAFSPTQRATLRGMVDRLPLDGTSGVDVLHARLQLGSAAEVPDIARELLERAALDPRRGVGYLHTALALEGEVERDLLLPWLARRLGEIRAHPTYGAVSELRALLTRAGPWLPEPLLGEAEACFRALRVGVESRVTLLALLARHLPSRRAALQHELLSEVERVVGDPVRGHGLTAREVEEYGNTDTLRAAVAFGACGHFEGEVRASLVRRGLALVERTPSGVDHRYDFDGLGWGQVARVADDATLDEAARVALSIKYRPVALKALGELVAAAPARRRDLCLLGLSRLAEQAPAERLADVTEKVERALLLGAGAPAHPTRADRAAEPIAAENDALVTAFVHLYGADSGAQSHRLDAMDDALSSAQARRVAAHLLDEPRGYFDARRALHLARSAALAGTSERGALLAACLGRPGGAAPPFIGEVSELVEALLSLCPAGDTAWATRLAGWIRHHAWDTEQLLAMAAAIAPLLLRLGGAQLLRELLPQLRAPSPAAAFARPWASAAIGSFEA